MTELTDRQLTVARLVADGLTDQQIAARLEVSDRRVRQLVSIIATKWSLDASRSYRVQIALRMQRAA